MGIPVDKSGEGTALRPGLGLELWSLQLFNTRGTGLGGLRKMPRLVMPKPPGGAEHPPASETLQANTEAEMRAWPFGGPPFSLPLSRPLLFSKYFRTFHPPSSLVFSDKLRTISFPTGLHSLPLLKVY